VPAVEVRGGLAVLKSWVRLLRPPNKPVIPDPESACFIASFMFFLGGAFPRRTAPCVIIEGCHFIPSWPWSLPLEVHCSPGSRTGPRTRRKKNQNQREVEIAGERRLIHKHSPPLSIARHARGKGWHGWLLEPRAGLGRGLVGRGGAGAAPHGALGSPRDRRPPG